VLVGRDRELATIATAMTLVRDAQRVVHLVGEPGIGKTALAERVSALAAAHGWTVAWGRTWNAASASPYWPWQQVLGSLLRTTDIADRCHRATLARLVELSPAVAGLAEAPPPTLDPDRARAALLRAVVHVLETAAADRPLMVVLDDVHAADAASLELAALVARSLPNSPVLLLSTQRPMGRAADSVGPRWLGELNRQGTVLPVGPLDRAAVAAQAAALTGRDHTAGEIVQLYRPVAATRSSSSSCCAGHRRGPGWRRPAGCR
jgi:predicted ATPase